MQTPDNLLRITCYDLATFLSEVQAGIKAGYELDLVSNANYPQQIGVVFTCTLTKPEEVQKETKQQETKQEVVPDVETQGQEEQKDAPVPKTKTKK